MSSTALAVVPEKVSSEDSDFRVGLTKWLMDAHSFRKHVAAAIAQTAVLSRIGARSGRGGSMIGAAASAVGTRARLP